MKALILLRHSLTEASARRLYCGWSDPPLSPDGRALATETAVARALPPCDCLVSSGLRRADETLVLIAGRGADHVLPDLREMHFGAFEMRGYAALKDDPDYRRWMLDETGSVSCPGGESRNGFAARVRAGGRALLALPGEQVLAVLHGGVIVALMQTWFPGENRGFYDWQPAACRGYWVTLREGLPSSWAAV